MKPASAIRGGIVGAVVLTLIHETLRRVTRTAPRMDKLGMEAIAKTLNNVDAGVPEEATLFKITMAGDIVSNSLYYSLAGIGDSKHSIISGSLIGLFAGIGGVYLPRPLGLNTAPSNRTDQTRLLTIALYTTGGLVAGLAGKIIEENT